MHDIFFIHQFQFNVKNRDDVDKLDAQLDSMQSQVRAKHNQERSVCLHLQIFI